MSKKNHQSSSFFTPKSHVLRWWYQLHTAISPHCSLTNSWTISPPLTEVYTKCKGSWQNRILNHHQGHDIVPTQMPLGQLLKLPAPLIMTPSLFLPQETFPARPGACACHPSTMRLSQEDCPKLKPSLGYIASSKPAGTTKQEPISKKRNKQTKKEDILNNGDYVLFSLL